MNEVNQALSEADIDKMMKKLELERKNLNRKKADEQKQDRLREEAEEYVWKKTWITFWDTYKGVRCLFGVNPEVDENPNWRPFIDSKRGKCPHWYIAQRQLYDALHQSGIRLITEEQYEMMLTNASVNSVKGDDDDQDEDEIRDMLTALQITTEDSKESLVTEIRGMQQRMEQRLKEHIDRKHSNTRNVLISKTAHSGNKVDSTMVTELENTQQLLTDTQQLLDSANDKIASANDKIASQVRKLI